MKIPKLVNKLNPRDC